MADVSSAQDAPSEARHLLGKVKAELVNIDITDYDRPEDVSGLGEFDQVIAILGLGISDQDYVWEYDDANENIIAKTFNDTGDGTGGVEEASATTDVGSQTCLVIGYA